LLAENRPGVLIPFEGSKAAFKILPPWHRRSQKEIGDAILKDIRERPRPSGNFTADTNGAPAAACPSLAHHQAALSARSSGTLGTRLGDKCTVHGIATGGVRLPE
jgi:hypothetical protein